MSPQGCKTLRESVSLCKAGRLLRTAEDVAPWTPSVTSDCKRQLSKSHILADSGTDLIVGWFAVLKFRGFLANASLQSDVMDSVSTLGKSKPPKW
jgi:hypothetical protein